MPPQTTEGSGPRVLIAGGGTGGHIIPALAIAREMRDRYGADVRFAGTPRGLESKLVPEAGFPLNLIEVGQLKNVSLATRVKTLGDLPRSIVHCAGLLQSFRPAAVVGVGGYASGPAMMAALLLRIPTLAFEPNAAPGLANRLVGRFVSAAAVNFPETASHFRNAHATGIPVRAEFFSIPPRRPGGPKRLLVMGGSQGARALNNALPEIAAKLLERVPGLTVVHQSGERHREATESAYRAQSIDAARVRVVGFMNSVEEIAAADLVLCRSGASSVAELCAAGRPAVYVPFPQAADDHQTRNAAAMVQAGAAALLRESDMSPETLLALLTNLVGDDARLAGMSAAARRQARPDAVREIGALVQSLF